MNSSRVIRTFCLALLAAVPGAVFAQDTASASACEDKGTNGMVSALLCPEGLDHETLAAAGRRICEDRADCGAWIWTEEADVPADLPGRHDDLEKTAVQSALAIWVNGKQQLIVLKKKSD